MAMSNKGRQKLFRDKQAVALADLKQQLAVATRPTMRSDPILLLEGILDGMLEIAWRAEQREHGLANHADNKAFRNDMLSRRDIVDALDALAVQVEPEIQRDFQHGLTCIMRVYQAARICTSFETE